MKKTTAVICTLAFVVISISACNYTNDNYNPTISTTVTENETQEQKRSEIYVEDNTEPVTEAQTDNSEYIIETCSFTQNDRFACLSGHTPQ